MSPSTKEQEPLANTAVGKIILRIHSKMGLFIQKGSCKTNRWYRAVEEADEAKKMDR